MITDHEFIPRPYYTDQCDNLINDGLTARVDRCKGFKEDHKYQDPGSHPNKAQNGILKPWTAADEQRWVEAHEG